MTSKSSHIVDMCESSASIKGLHSYAIRILWIGDLNGCLGALNKHTSLVKALGIIHFVFFHIGIATNQLFISGMTNETDILNLKSNSNSSNSRKPYVEAAVGKSCML